MQFFPECIFCKIIQKQIPSTIVAENDDVCVIKDINPKAPIHYLILPKFHVADVQSLDKVQCTVAARMFEMAQQLSAIDERAKDFRLQINSGAGVGQVVFHLHMHFLAGKKMADN